MRLVPGMSTAVDGQGAALNEGLAARFVVASIRALIGMYSVMALEIGFSVETLRDAIAISLWWVCWDVDKHCRGRDFGAGLLTFGQPSCHSH